MRALYRSMHLIRPYLDVYGYKVSLERVYKVPWFYECNNKNRSKMEKFPIQNEISSNENFKEDVSGIF